MRKMLLKHLVANTDLPRGTKSFCGLNLPPDDRMRHPLKDRTNMYIFKGISLTDTRKFN